MNRNIVETIVGAAVLIIAVVFVTFALKSGGQTDGLDGYKLKAAFDSIDGLSTGSDVRISGMKVGTVTNQKLDEKSYQAVITFTVSKTVELPADSSAKIVSAGLLGGKYLSLVPGADDVMLEDGESIEYTQSSVSIEELIGKFAFGSVGGKDDDSEKSGAGDSAL